MRFWKWPFLLSSIFIDPTTSSCSTDILNCEGNSQKNASLDWSLFSSHLRSSTYLPDEREDLLHRLASVYGSDAGVARECRMGLATVFYQLSKLSLSRNDLQTSHNLNQLAMAMVWDVSRTHYDCLQKEYVWGIDWLGTFMQDYLGLAAKLRRHEDDGLPPRPRLDSEPSFAYIPATIAIATVCEYDIGHKLHGIDALSRRNRLQYSEKHGYVSVFKSVNEDAPGRHPVWASIALALNLLNTGNYDFVMWMDCDALFIDQSRKIEEILQMYPGKDIYISEDGRGLSGGNWIVKNSRFAKKVLQDVFSNRDFDKWDLRDQFGLLWTLLRPSIEKKLGSSEFFGYPSQVALVPQRLLNAYPWSLCRPSHHCFEDGKDFIVSFITLGSLSGEMAWHLLNDFSNRN